MENVTERKHRCKIPQKSSSLTDLSKESIFDATMMSLPNSSLEESLSLSELSEKIKLLTEQLENTNQQLNIAHQEIDNLHSENYRLKMDLNKSLIIIENYKKVGIMDQIKGTPLSEKKKKNNKSTLSTPSKSEIISQAETKRPNREDNTNHQKSSPTVITTTLKSESNIKRKLCILSNRHYSARLRSIEATFSTDFKFSRYLSPNATIKQLVTNLQNKLSDFTLNDYCVIVLGEIDFRMNCNFVELIGIIRNAIQEINHTNIVICTPTYIRGAPIFNYKIETFNNLLYVELQHYEHAYFFDSNDSLKLEMFSDITGRINQRGLLNIYENIMKNFRIDFEKFPLIITNKTNVEAIEIDSQSKNNMPNHLFRA